MTPEFLALWIAAVAVTACLTSGSIGAMTLGSEQWIARLAPVAQSRIFLMAALAPALVSLAVVGVVVFDVLIPGGAERLCRRHAAAVPPTTVLLIATVLVGRLGHAVGRAFVGARRSRSTRRALETLGSQTRSGFWIVPVEEVYALVVGLFRPQVYISQGLLAAADRRDLEPVLAHERSHVRRRDPLRRLIASLALSFHLPGVAWALDRRLARSQEIAADAEGAREIGDSGRFAEALVRLARIRVAHPALAAGFLGNDVEARVRDLLLAGPRPDRPRGALLVFIAVGLLILGLLAADAVHDGAEALFGLLTG